MIQYYTNQESQRHKRDLYYIFLMFLLFVTFLNFGARYYIWIYVAFVAFIITPGRRIRMNFFSALLLIMAILMLVFDAGRMSSIGNLLMPFSFVVSYTIGIGIPMNNETYDQRINEIRNIIYITTFGLFTHYILNMITNLGALERDTVDIWTKDVLGATGQACLASMCVGVVASLMFSKSWKSNKVTAIVLSVVIIVYNLILAGRTLLFLMIVVFILALVYRNFYYKKDIIKVLFIIAIVGVLLYYAYNANIFNIKTMFEDSNFYWRFVEQKNANLFEDSRLEKKMVYISHLLDYPFGGTHIRSMYGAGFYAHDLYLDSYDQYGVFVFLIIVIYMVSSIRHMIRFLRLTKVPFDIKQLVFCTYMVLNIQFWLEPIMQGMPFLFMAYCMIDGTVTHFLTTMSDLEEADG